MCKTTGKRMAKRNIPLKTYQVTNDGQRLELIRRVVGPEKLTIREVILRVKCRLLKLLVYAIPLPKPYSRYSKWKAELKRRRSALKRELWMMRASHHFL